MSTLLAEGEIPAVAAPPFREVVIGNSSIRLLGTAHVSRASRDAVAHEIAVGDYDCIAVELCANRLQAMRDPNAFARLDLVQVIRQGKASMVVAMLALGAFQQRLATKFGIEPGAEMRAAFDGAQRRNLALETIDRDIGITLRRIYRGVSWWRRAILFSGLMLSALSTDSIGEEEIERLKDSDLLEATFAEFARHADEIYVPLVTERDRFMAARLLQLVDLGHRRILAVVGAGHLSGLSQELQNYTATATSVLQELNAVPSSSRWGRALPWLLAIFIVGGIALGFARNPEIGWAMVRDWIVLTGGLSALGAFLAGAHPLTIITAFLGAPLTTLHPAIGIGMFTALTEGYLRRPTVGDFKNLRYETTHWRGWWRNRVARTLLVFVLSGLGASLGTYIGGYRIGSALLG
ncbi:MAG: TraB/GumN family protein [Gammaproteobacteria bacterium]|nr:TraB/GumN family protein [Gammaproteobacteria bacterium]